MPLRILVIPDKFKGTLSAGAAALAIATGWRKARRHDSLDLLPMTDGGDGFGEVISGLLRAKVQRLKTVDAAHRPCFARWWWEPQTKTAIVESAAIIGLAMLPPKKFYPFVLDTFGLGAVIRAATAKGAKRCLMGIGGSATNDGGFGLARSLGWKFLDRNANLIEHWTGLDQLAKIRAPAPRCCLRQMMVAVDVQNPLLGSRGATRVYGPQKGLRSRDFVRAECCLRRLAKVAKKDFGRDLARAPGAGAAGGLGFGLLAFLSAQLESGYDLFARQAKLDRHLRAADLVIVGEGAIDSSTFMGKGVGQIAARCREQGIPCVALTGFVSAGARKRRLFTQIHALTQLTTVKQAKAKPVYWLEQLAMRVAQSWKTSNPNHPSHWKGTKHHAV
ncbi:MAG: glycerate kinase [Verrucomicrobiota bacterium]|jgi:glycerate kinase